MLLSSAFATENVVPIMVRSGMTIRLKSMIKLKSTMTLNGFPITFRL